MPDTIPFKDQLTPGALQLVEKVKSFAEEDNVGNIYIEHWLFTFIERHSAMAENLVHDIDIVSLKSMLNETISSKSYSNILKMEEVIKKASAIANSRSKTIASERDIAFVILSEAGYKIIEDYKDNSIASDKNTDKSPAKNKSILCQTKKLCPTLDKYGRDLTKEALENQIPPIVGRDNEIQLLIETLCRRTKRNPVLVGPAGVGKTAIVEGFAKRIASGDAPSIFNNVRVIAIQPSHLVAGASVIGEIEKRMKAIISEASQEGIIIFIDEIHSIVGAGGREGTGDLASLLKPSLARGDIACIAATTTEEYRRFIEADTALERRFQPIYVDELTIDQTLIVVSAIRDSFASLHGVEVSDKTLRNIVHFADQFMKNRYFPDKAVDLLEQCIANAVLEGKTRVKDTDAEEVVQRMVGMPTSLSERFGILQSSLSRSLLLNDENIEKLINRLQVTMRGLDINPARPNAIILMIGDAFANAAGLATILAEEILGGPDRVISIDFGRLTNEHDISSLIGAPPGYVGYKDSLPLDRVSQMNWCVLRCDNIDSCHPNVLRLLTQALRDGFITDSRGKHVYLSDAVVILTALIDKNSTSSLGFRVNEESEEDIESCLKKSIDSSLLDQVDLIISEIVTTNASNELGFEKGLLSEFIEIYKKRGIDLIFDDSLIEWLVTQRKVLSTKRDWERLADEQLSPHVIPFLSDSSKKDELSLLIKYERNALCIKKIKKEAK